jgi:hypothetical protein
VFAHLPVNKKVELALFRMILAMVQKKENNFCLISPYVLPLQNNHKLRISLKAGFTSLQTNFNGIESNFN